MTSKALILSELILVSIAVSVCFVASTSDNGDEEDDSEKDYEDGEQDAEYYEDAEEDAEYYEDGEEDAEDEEEDADVSVEDYDDEKDVHASAGGNVDRDEQTICEAASSCRDWKPTDLLSPRSCDCDYSCARHITCCVDSPYRNVSLPSTSEECTWVENIGSSIFMVSKCDPAWKGPGMVKKLCEGDQAFLFDPVSIIPVTNTMSGVTYGNIFCSMCNGESRDIIQWDFSAYMALFHPLYGGIYPRVVLHSESEGWGYLLHSEKEGDVFIQAEIHIKIPFSLKALVSECIPRMVSRCADDWKDDEIRKKCKSYMDALQIPRENIDGFTDKKGSDDDDTEDYNTDDFIDDSSDYVDSITYRNINCAICNHQLNLTNSTCRLVAAKDDSYVDKLRGKDLSLRFSHRLPDNSCLTRFGEVGNLAILYLCRTVICDPGYNIVKGTCVKN